jgi:hypothetical protein
LKSLRFKKGEQALTFEIKILIQKGILLGTRINETFSTTRDECKVSLDIHNAHTKLGHILIAETRKIAKSLF